jgi:SAM-dependent methyltransferase
LCYPRTGKEVLAGGARTTLELPALKACLIVSQASGNALMFIRMFNISSTLKKILSRILLAGLGAFVLSWPAKGAAGETTRRPCISAAQVLQLASSLAVKDLRDAYPVAVKLAFGNAPKDVAAFEENRTFVYAAGAVPWRGAAGHSSKPDRWLRRWIVLKPSIFILDDQLDSPAAAPCIDSETKPQISGSTFRVEEGGGSLAGNILPSHNAQLRAQRLAATALESDRYHIQWASSESSRLICVLSANGSNSKAATIHSEMTTRGGLEKLTITAGGKVFHLELPLLDNDAGRIEVSSLRGKALLSRRPFPAGILPHGPEGSRLLEEWDRDYQGAKPPAWDIRQPADELQKAVKSGSVHPGRAVDLCCGTGTDAIYLAHHGFQVTAIDIAPTALSQALQKAQSAGVAVDWLLADVLALPKLKPFDFIYDRGCYHVVRDQNLDAYLDALRRVSHPGTQMLLLAARRDPQQGSGSPMGVTEDELRFDFLPLFEIETLQAIRLQSNEPGPGPLGWVVLMRRKAQP